MKRIKIKDSIYYRDIFLMANCSLEEYNKYLVKEYGLERSELSNADVNARFEKIINESKGFCHYYIWIGKFDWRIFEYALLSHEINHLVFQAMRDIGMELCNESEEAYTYYAQRLTTDILVGIDKAKKKAKKRKKK